MKILYQIKLSYCCAGIIVNDNIVIETAPIFKWMIGKNFNYCKDWVRKKEGQIIEVKEE